MTKNPNADLLRMSPPRLKRELGASIDNERKLRQRLYTLEEAAAALRESKSSLLSEHADEMAQVRTELNLAVRRSTLIRERLRATDLVSR